MLLQFWELGPSRSFEDLGASAALGIVGPHTGRERKTFPDKHRKSFWMSLPKGVAKH